MFTYNMPILYSDCLILRQLIVSSVNKNLLLNVSYIGHWSDHFCHMCRWIRVNYTNWDVSYIRMKVIDKALILMLNYNLGSTTFCKINDESS